MMTKWACLVLVLVGACGDNAPGAEGVPEDGMCPTADWCWQAPTPQGNGLRASFGFARDDAWMVGDNGAVLHWDGSAWAFVPAPSHENLRGVWGMASNDVWMWGEDAALLHWDGTALKHHLAPPGDVLAVWGSGDDALWLSSAEGGMYEGNGTGWMPVAAPAHATTIRGRAANDIDAVDAMAHVAMHFDGTAWTYVTLAISAQTVWPDPDGSTWYAGRDDVAELDHVVGPSERVLPLGSNVNILEMLGFTPHEFWMLTDAGDVVHAVHGDGLTFLDTGLGLGARTIWGADALDVWAGGVHGGLARFQQEAVDEIGTWRVEQAAATAPLLSGIAGHHATDLWAFTEHALAPTPTPGASNLFHYDGKAWSPADGIGDDTVAALATYHDDGEMIALANNRVMWFDGKVWSTVHVSAGPLVAVATIGDDIWASSSAGQLAHFDGTQWEERAFGAGAVAITAARADDVTFLTGDGRLVHWDGVGLGAPIALDGIVPVGIAAIAPDVVLVATPTSVVRVEAGVAGGEVDAAMTDISMIVARGADDVWVGATDGTVSHFDGDRFTPEWSGTKNLRSLFAIPKTTRLVAAGALDADPNPDGSPTGAVLAHR